MPFSTKLPKLDAVSTEKKASKGRAKRMRRPKRKKRKAKKKRAGDAVFFRSTIIAWGPSSGYAPAKPAVTLTRAEEKKLQKPGFIRESPRNRSRRRAKTGMKRWRKNRDSLEPIVSTPSVESLVTVHDSIEENQKDGKKTPLLLEPILSTRKLEANAKSNEDAAEEGNADKTKEPSKNNADGGKSTANEIEVPLTDAQMFTNIANSLGNIVETEQTEYDSILRIKNDLGEIVDASELKMMQDILAEKNKIDPMDPNEPPPDAQVGELESEETLPPSLDSYEFHDKDAMNLASYFEAEDDGAILLKAGQKCDVFRPAYGVDWWPGRILAVNSADSDANATYTVEFLSGYYLGDMATEVSRSNIDASRPFRNWMGTWRGEVGQHLFEGSGLGVGKATQNSAGRRDDDWASRWEREVGQHLFAGKEAAAKERQDVNPGPGWKSKWQQEVGQYLFTR